MHDPTVGEFKRIVVNMPLVKVDLAESTVKNHVTLIMKALNVTSRTQAVIAAARMGLVCKRPALPHKAAEE